MKTLGELTKGKTMHHVTTGTTVFDTVTYMAENNIGAVPVLEKEGRLRGIFSERDLLKRCIAKGIDIKTTLVEDVMTKGVIVIESHDTYDYCLKIMKQESIRHIPVREGEKLIGMISMRDLLMLDSDEKAEEIGFLKSYISY
jgi:CBS domain-containing protein